MKAEEKLDQEVDRLWQQMRYAYEHGGGHAGHLNNAWHTAMRLSKELRHLHNEVRVLAETLQRCKEISNFTAECYRLDLERDEALLRQALDLIETMPVKHPDQITPRNALTVSIKKRLQLLLLDKER